jgi:hypothetical protein
MGNLGIGIHIGLLIDAPRVSDLLCNWDLVHAS